jgi:hypothetical protein
MEEQPADSRTKNVIDLMDELELLGGRVMIAFVIPLPFAIGIPHHSTFQLLRDEELSWLAESKWYVSDEGPELPDLGSRVSVSVRILETSSPRSSSRSIDEGHAFGDV